MQFEETKVAFVLRLGVSQLVPQVPLKLQVQVRFVTEGDNHGTHVLVWEVPLAQVAVAFQSHR